jgi:hypothetical protein
MAYVPRLGTESCRAQLLITAEGLLIQKFAKRHQMISLELNSSLLFSPDPIYTTEETESIILIIGSGILGSSSGIF